MKKVSKIEATKTVAPRLLKVAAYARVSAETDRTIHSLSTQISFYSDLIQKTRGWQYVGVYADNFISGTEIERRPEFKRLLQDCEDGKIDIVLTKSISRFARNTVDLLETVRHLKELGVEVRFEKERINSLSEDGEIMLTLLASFAEEEVRSLSENVRWAVKKKFERGKPNSYCLYGYRWDGEKFIVVPEEAKIVRLIYQNFLDGLSAEETEKQLEQMGVKSYTGQHFSNSSIRAILKNEKYTGNMLLQKEYTENHITHKSKKNKGELPMYWVENSHEAIISLETYQKVQDEIARRRELGALANWSIPTNQFTSKIKCGCCGASFVKSTRRNKAKSSQLGDKISFYMCATKKKGKSPCTSGTIRDSVLEEECAKTLGIPEFDAETFSAQVKQITIPATGTMIFEMADGRIVEHHWFRNAKKDSWTPELREQASAYRRRNPAKGKKGVTCLTAKIRCGCCGSNYRRQAYTNAAGEKLARWYCANQKEKKAECHMPGVDEIFMKETLAKALGLDVFDETAFSEQVDYIKITDIGKLTVFFKNGRTYNGTYAANRYGAPFTEEKRRKHGEAIRKYWRERNGK
ncbi:recombinase family protein [Enterocloster clostridioformis]|uniref:recombinase family protein n=1 Tax=Enterocloster clostridioformis TaxID=1531 RepID=UPI0034A2375C